MHSPLNHCPGRHTDHVRRDVVGACHPYPITPCGNVHHRAPQMLEPKRVPDQAGMQRELEQQRLMLALARHFVELVDQQVAPQRRCEFGAVQGGDVVARSRIGHREQRPLRVFSHTGCSSIAQSIT